MNFIMAKNVGWCMIEIISFQTHFWFKVSESMISIIKIQYLWSRQWALMHSEIIGKWKMVWWRSRAEKHLNSSGGRDDATIITFLTVLSDNDIKQSCYLCIVLFILVQVVNYNTMCLNFCATYNSSRPISFSTTLSNH